jgi:ribosome-binding protein aMBF1 (putative translation factor)
MADTSHHSPQHQRRRFAEEVATAIKETRAMSAASVEALRQRIARNDEVVEKLIDGVRPQNAEIGALRRRVRELERADGADGNR